MERAGTDELIAPLPIASGQADVSKVLIVDDSRFVRASLAKHLRGQHEYIEVEDGLAAWERITHDPGIRLVISDVQLPNLDGYGLLQLIRNSEIASIRCMPVMIISGNEEEAKKASELGATEFISKSVDALELLLRVGVLMKLTAKHASQQKLMTPKRDMIKNEEDWEEKSVVIWSFARRHQIDLTLISMRLNPIESLLALPEDVVKKVVNKIHVFITQTLQKTLRREDILLRMPDDEFIIVAVGISPQEGTRFCERLSRIISRVRMNYAGRDLRLTTVFGIAAKSQEATDQIQDLRLLASRRSRMAQNAGVTSLVGRDEEAKLAGLPVQPQAATATISLSEALNLIAQGQEQRVVPYLQQLMDSIKPLLELVARQQKQSR